MTKRNENIVRRIQETWDAGKLKQLDKFFSPAFSSEAGIPGMPPTLDSAKMAHGMTQQAFPDRKVSIEDTFSAADKVVVRCRMIGTNTGGVPWFGVGPNGNSVDVQWISIYQFAEGKVVKHWAVNDGIALLAQLGAIKPPGSEM